MDRGAIPPPLRSLPRCFLVGLDPSATEVELPKSEADHFRKVLRLGTGDHLAILPGDGTIWRCELRGLTAHVLDKQSLDTESPTYLTLALALPKGDKLDDIVRMTTELGVAEFILFPSQRTVVRWTPEKVEGRLRRLHVIAREAAEVAFRSRIPQISFLPSLEKLLAERPDAYALSEFESVSCPISDRLSARKITLIVGPEGGWTHREHELFGDRTLSLGPRVLRVETAAVSAAALVLASGG